MICSLIPNAFLPRADSNPPFLQCCSPFYPYQTRRDVRDYSVRTQSILSELILVSIMWVPHRGETMGAPWGLVAALWGLTTRSTGLSFTNVTAAMQSLFCKQVSVGTIPPYTLCVWQLYLMCVATIPPVHSIFYFSFCQALNFSFQSPPLPTNRTTIRLVFANPYSEHQAKDYSNAPLLPFPLP